MRLFFSRLCAHTIGKNNSSHVDWFVVDSPGYFHVISEFSLPLSLGQIHLDQSSVTSNLDQQTFSLGEYHQARTGPK